ncbi:MAG: hypothetical protein IJW63_05185 [Lachnospiraceae bacterium]|nr:hypothetical protein [Lachnospiraceae bacterium]
MKSLKKLSFYEWLFLIVLLLYPFRHVNIGLDFWDTGYNYANFIYGFDHMDPMWFFSTYLANVVGHFFSLLPFGDTLIGLNVYTASTISLAALVSYFFLRRTLQIPSVLAFLGLFLTINLCWCPTALLYNYLTYLFMFLCIIFLYKGLTKHQNKYLFLAGLCLGTNVLVRFSNAAEAALIVGVWAYAFIETLEDEEVSTLKWKVLKPVFLKKLWSRIWRTTLWCLGGYLTSLVVFLGYIAIRYGISTYVEAISRLFGMTEESTGYTPTAMLMNIYYNYRQSLDWFLYLAGFGVVAWLICLLVGLLKKISDSKLLSFVVIGLQSFTIARFFIAVIDLFYQKEMFITDYHSYFSMFQPVIVLIILTMIVAVVKVLAPGVPKEEKLISGLVVLVNFITSIGSNTGLYPCINNTFILMTYLLWQLYKLFTEAKFLKIKKWKISLTPIWAYLVLYICFLAYQSVGFGTTFVFAEATGIVGATTKVENNDVLAGVYMQEDRAEAMTELSAFVDSMDMKGRTTITYDYRPSLSFYLEMPPAFNAWLDLPSYQLQYLNQDLAEVSNQILSDPDSLQNYPVLITTPAAATAEYDGQWLETTKVKKWFSLQEFMQTHQYEVVFENDFFVVYDVTTH